jgi:hypothetical protein
VVDVTALYYTFSTIAQSLAGAFAVLAAFALFRLSSLERDVTNAQGLLKNLSSNDGAWSVLRDCGFDALKEFLKLEHGTWSKPDVAVHCAGHTAWRAWQTIRVWLYLTLVATVLDIGLCIAALPFVPRLVCAVAWAWTVLVSALVLSAACLLLYTGLVIIMVRPRD